MTEARPGYATYSPQVQASASALRLHRVAFWAFFISLAVVGLSLFEPAWFEGWAQIPEVTTLLLGTLTAVSIFLLELPAQNVVLAVGVIAALSLAGDILNAGITGQNAKHLTASLTWWSPLVRIFATLISRAVARLVLRPRSAPASEVRPNYGLWVLGLTVALALGFEMALAACMQIPDRTWRKDAGVQFHGWYASWAAIAGRALALLVTTALITPTLIDKRPGPSAIQSADRAILRVWCLATLLLLCAALANGWWLAAGFIALLALSPFWLRIFAERQFHH